MKDFSIYRCLFIVILISVLSSCQSEKQSEFPTKKDLFQIVRPYLQESTEKISFGKDANPQQFFLHGWNGPEQKYTWADGQKSSLFFYQYNAEEDGEITIICQSIGLPARQETLQQTTKVFLNEHEIGSFVALPFEFKEFVLSLPKEFLELGRNTLEFEFAFFDKGKQDKRRKSVAFNEIRFANNDTVKYINDRELLQRKDANLDFYWELPESFWLNVSYQSLQGAKTSLELVSEDQKAKHIKLSSRKQEYSKLVQLPVCGNLSHSLND